MKRNNLIIPIAIFGFVVFLISVRVSVSFAETGDSSFRAVAGAAVDTMSSVANTVTGSALAPQTLRAMSIDPQSPIVETGTKISFKARMASGEGISNVSWSIPEANGGSVNSDGSYVAPSVPGVFHVIARALGYADRYATVTVRAPIGQVTETTEAVRSGSGTSETPAMSVTSAVPVTTVTTVTTKTEEAQSAVETSVMVPPPAAAITTVNTTHSANTAVSGVACTMDAKQCPDGTYVGRTGSKCEFVCPTVIRVETQKTEVQKVVTPTAKPATASQEIKANIGKTEDRVSSSSAINTATTTTPTVVERIPVSSSTELQNVVLQAEAVQATVMDGKERLLKILDQHISDVTKEKGLPQSATSTAAIKAVRDRLEVELISNLTSSVAAQPEKIKEIGARVNDSLGEISRLASSTLEAKGSQATSTSDISRAIESIVATMGDTANALKASGGDLLYKDSNNDGISDYDSVHLYNIDPIKPSPVTAIEGRQVTAGEKVILGYDPAKLDPVKIVPEQPRDAAAPIVLSYKVTEVKLAPDTKKVELKGQALPNSFVTLYIYSTPIIVTVKTDSNGEWNYTLDKELENGDHTVYTASVNNSGKIVARSSGFAFVKTAEAATLDTVPGGVQASADASQPTILETNKIYLIIIVFFAIVLVAIGLIGMTMK